MLRINTTGRRKSSVARIYLSEGKGDFVINNRLLADYFPSELFRSAVTQPFESLSCLGGYDVKAVVKGGGVRGQSEAIRLAVAKACCEVDISNRAPLKAEGFLKRDPREVERKKYGRKKARKRFQFSKR